MKVVGIVVEYNPFHNGHMLHLNETKKASNPDVTIAVMSGNFVMRGEPALFDKWTRAALAIEGGVDLVVELPYAYAVQSADLFAFGSIDLLNKLGVTDLYFGSEKNNIVDLQKVVDVMEKEQFHDQIKSLITEGNSYPSAFGKAIHTLTNLNFTSNDNLGIQYIQNIRKLNAKINAHTILRENSKYLDTVAVHESIASATAIRAMSDPVDYVPSFTYDIWNTKHHTWEDYYPLLSYKLTTDQDLSKYFLVEEGIENRFLKELGQPTFRSYVDALYTRRYPQNRIRRTLTHILNNVTKEEMELLHLEEGVPYIRILAMNETGRLYLNKIKKDFEPKIISKANEIEHPMMNLEVRTTTVYNKELKVREFQPMVYKK